MRNDEYMYQQPRHNVAARKALPDCFTDSWGSSTAGCTELRRGERLFYRDSWARSVFFTAEKHQHRNERHELPSIWSSTVCFVLTSAITNILFAFRPTRGLWNMVKGRRIVLCRTWQQGQQSTCFDEENKQPFAKETKLRKSLSKMYETRCERCTDQPTYIHTSCHELGWMFYWICRRGFTVNVRYLFVEWTLPVCL